MSDDPRHATVILTDRDGRIVYRATLPRADLAALKARPEYADVIEVPLTFTGQLLSVHSPEEST